MVECMKECLKEVHGTRNNLCMLLSNPSDVGSRIAIEPTAILRTRGVVVWHSSTRHKDSYGLKRRTRGQNGKPRADPADVRREHGDGHPIPQHGIV
mmetsp:Transcript_3502/g.9324  ORF Transcript_3502/g.9324 Transcript_3502/m.9324 type:complete len:96 (-) Transcript_3502:912-1199(-)